jgi:hypothetical protein
VAAVYGRQAARAAVGTIYRYQLWGSLEESVAAADSRVRQYMVAYSMELSRRGLGCRSSCLLHERRRASKAEKQATVVPAHHGELK